MWKIWKKETATTEYFWLPICTTFWSNKIENYLSKYLSWFYGDGNTCFSSYCRGWLSKLLFMFGLDWASMVLCFSVLISTMMEVVVESMRALDTLWRKRRWGLCIIYIFLSLEYNTLHNQCIDVAEIRLLAWQSINQGNVMDVVIFSFVYAEKGHLLR